MFLDMFLPQLFISNLQQFPRLFGHKLRLFYFPPSTVSPQTVEALQTSCLVLDYRYKANR